MNRKNIYTLQPPLFHPIYLYIHRSEDVVTQESVADSVSSLKEELNNLTKPEIEESDSDSDSDDDDE